MSGSGEGAGRSQGPALLTKPEPSDCRCMGARQRLGRAEKLFRGSHPPNSVVPCTPRAEQVCSPASMAERRCWLMLAALRTRRGLWPGDCLGSVDQAHGSVAGCCRGEILGLLFERRLFVDLAISSSTQGWNRHPQRGGQLGQRQLGGPKPAATFLDVVDGHAR